MYKLSKAPCELKQAPRAWYERLRDFLVSKAFKMEKAANTTLFTKRIENDSFVCQIYMDDITIGSIKSNFVKILEK